MISLLLFAFMINTQDNIARANDNRPLVIGTFEGGGRLALITAYMAEALTTAHGKPFHTMFDEVFGVSINTVLCASLWPLEKTGEPLFTAQGYKDYFKTNGDTSLTHKWFFGSLVQKVSGVTTSYNVSGLEAMIHKEFGDLKLSDFADGLNIYVWSPKEHKKIFLSSDDAKTDPSKDYYMRDLLRSAVSFPSAIKTKPIESMNGELRHFFDMAAFGTCPARMGVEITQIKYGRAREIVPVIFGCGRFNLNGAEEAAEQTGILNMKQVMQSANSTEVAEDRRRVARLCPQVFTLDVTLDETAHTFSPIKDVIPIAERAVFENVQEMERIRRFLNDVKSPQSAAEIDKPEADRL